MDTRVLTRRRRGAAAAVLFTALALVAACGGGSSSSDSSSGGSSSGGSSNVTSGGGSSGGSGGTTASCIDLALKFQSAAAQVATTGGGAGSTEDLNGLVKTFESVTSSLPESIRGDWKLYIEYLEGLSKAMGNLDMNNLTDPSKMQAYTDALAKYDDPKYDKARDNINAYFDKQCPNLVRSVP